MPPIATLLAFVTIALWSTLAVLGARLNHVPPFLLVGIALCTSGVLGAGGFRQWRVPLQTFGVGIWGIFGYHFLFFTAFRYAPPVEANLINYLWPLLIVLLSPLLLSGYRLRPYHLLGALMGLAGAGLIATGGRLSLDIANLKGYLFAAGAAFAWSSYSLLTKRVPAFPTAAVGGFCLFSGLMSLGLYAISGPAAAISGLTLEDWLFLLLLGLGPMGAAFFTWDAALKRGDPRIIGSLAYLTPLLSTFNLVVLGGRAFTWVSAVAMLLIVSGAVIGSLDLFRPAKRLTHSP
jgi:drug/metabolite transporter (DMT)-like permease